MIASYPAHGMPIMELVTFALRAIAWRYILGESAVLFVPRLLMFQVIAVGPRRFTSFMLRMWYCPACFGFWVGLGVALASGTPLLDGALISLVANLAWASLIGSHAADEYETMHRLLYDRLDEPEHDLDAISDRDGVPDVRPQAPQERQVQQHRQEHSGEQER